MQGCINPLTHARNYTYLQQFDAHLETQRSRLQVELSRRLEEFNGDVAGFGSRCVCRFQYM